MLTDKERQALELAGEILRAHGVDRVEVHSHGFTVERNTGTWTYFDGYAADLASAVETMKAAKGEK